MTLRRPMWRSAWDFAVVLAGVVLLALICLLWAIVALVLLPLLTGDTGRRVGRRAATFWFRFYLAVMEVLGAWHLDLEELDALQDAGPLVLAPNHPCLLDAVLVVSRLPNAVCVMKSTLLNNFLLGPAARLARYVRNDTLLRLITRASEELRAGGQLLLFPEGTRSNAQPIGPFTEAVGALSRRANVPVQALIIEADSGFLGKGGSLARIPALPLAYRVRIGRRFDPPQDVRAFTVALEQYFQRELSGRESLAPGEAVVGQPVVEAPRIHG